MEAASSVAPAAAQIHLYEHRCRSMEALAARNQRQTQVMDHASFVHPRSVAQ